VDVVLIICVRLTLNNSGVLNGVVEVKDVLLDVVVGNVEVVEIKFKRVLLEFKETRLAQDVGLLIIRMILEPT
jgi:hypothetical protein